MPLALVVLVSVLVGFGGDWSVKHWKDGAEIALVNSQKAALESRNSILETANGNKYVPGVASPTADQIDYLFGQVTGGVRREAGKARQSVKAMYTGEDLAPHKIPLVGRFYGNSEGQSSQGNAFYSNLMRINEVEAELKGRRKDRLPIDEFKAENPECRFI
jgi:hypothetical protein